MLKAREPYILDPSPISEKTRQKAEKELRETPEIVKAAILELRELLKNDDTICYRDDDDFLIIFLRPCKFYAKSAHELMKRIAEFRDKQKVYLDNLMPNDERDAFMNHNVVNVLTNRDQDGRRVMIVNCGGNWDPSKVTADQIFRIFYLIHEAAILEPETQVNGVVVLMDFENLGMKQAKAFTPQFSYRLLTFIQEAMPLRLKEIHMVKQPFIFNIVWNLFKPFIKDKLGKRIFFHGSKMPSLHKHMDPKFLPENYGGEMPKIDYSGADWFPCILDYDEHYKKMNSYGLTKKE